MAERRRWAAVLCLLAALLTACSGSSDAEPAAYSDAIVQLDAPYTPADVPLTDDAGEPFTGLEDPEHDVTLIFFGYTHCPDICQQVMSTIAAARLRLPEADRDRLGVVFVTTDPARDTGPVLRDYLDRFDPTFTGVTGDLPDIVRLGQSLAVAVEKGEKLPSGGYDVVHNDQVEALGSDGKVHAMWMRDVSAADLAADLRKLLEEESA